jgi:hypothetical protein
MIVENIYKIKRLAPELTISIPDLRSIEEIALGQKTHM